MNKTAQQSLQEAFAPRISAGKPGFEAWFLVATHFESQRALWLRYTRMTRASGGPPVSAIWVSLFDAGSPSKHLSFAEPVPGGFLESEEGRILTPTRLAGSVLTSSGKLLSWDLKIDGEAGVFDPLPRWLTRLPIGGTKDVIVEPRIRAQGTVTLGTDTMSFDGSRGSLHHMWGTRLSHEIYYLSVPHFDDDAEGWSLEAVSVRPDPSSPMLTWAVLGTPGGMHSSASVSRLLTSRCSPEYPKFQMEIRGGKFQVSLRASLPPNQITAYKFRDPDGSPRFVEQSDVCASDVEIQIEGKTRRLRSKSMAIVEFHRNTPWSPLAYHDPYGFLFSNGNPTGQIPGGSGK